MWNLFPALSTTDDATEAADQIGLPSGCGSLLAELSCVGLVVRALFPFRSCEELRAREPARIALLITPIGRARIGFFVDLILIA